MKKKHSGHNYGVYRQAGMLLCFILCTFYARAQSCFYLQNTGIGAYSSVTYHSFLLVETDGSALVRIRYKDPASGDDRLIELSLADTVVTAINPADSNKYLFSVADTRLIMGNSDSGFLTPRYIFKKVRDSLSSYYVPAGVDLRTGDGKWAKTSMVQNQTKTYDDLRKMQQFVGVFFSEEEPLYKFLTENKTRGTLAPRKEKMFLIVVANSNDPKIGVTSKKDFDNITTKFGIMAADMGVQDVITTPITGDGFSKKAVEDAISKLSPGPDDIVIFYYSGHGFRYTEDTSKYPRMSFRTQSNPERINNNLSLEAVYKQIIAKGAKVNIVLSDCCNEDIGAEPRVGQDMLKTKVGLFGTLNIENAKRLFFPVNRTFVIAGAADVNQLATGNPELGGFFTNFFMAELEKNLYSFSSMPSSWLRIFVAAREKARYQALTALCGTSRCVQTTAFRVLPAF